MLRRNFIASLLAIPVIAKFVSAQEKPPEPNTFIVGYDPVTERAKCRQHWSDCQTQNMPADPNGECNCFHVGARIEEIETGRKMTITRTFVVGPYVGVEGITDGDHRRYGVMTAGFKNWRRI